MANTPNNTVEFLSHHALPDKTALIVVKRVMRGNHFFYTASLSFFESTGRKSPVELKGRFSTVEAAREYSETVLKTARSKSLHDWLKSNQSIRSRTIQDRKIFRLLEENPRSQLPDLKKRVPPAQEYLLECRLRELVEQGLITIERDSDCCYYSLKSET